MQQVVLCIASIVILYLVITFLEYVVEKLK